MINAFNLIQLLGRLSKLYSKLFRKKDRKKYKEKIASLVTKLVCGIFENISYVKKVQSLLLIKGGDVELNPGPNKQKKPILLLTQNCRGLNNKEKLRQLMSSRRSQVQSNLYILALQETYLIEDSDLKWFGSYAFTKAESNHFAGCVTYFHETVKIIEQVDIDNRGHGHLVVVESLGGEYYYCREYLFTS